MGSAVDPFPHLAPGEEDVLDPEEQATAPDPYAISMRVFDLPKTEWAKQLKCCHSYYRGTQHDHHFAGWDGSPREEGAPYMGERWFPGSQAQANSFMPTGFLASDKVPYGLR